MRERLRVDAWYRMERTHLRDKVRELSRSLACPNGRAWPTDGVGSGLLSATGLAMRGGLHVLKTLRELGLEVGVASGGRSEDQWLRDNLATYGWPTRSPHVALLDAGEWSVELVQSPGVLWPQWFVLSRGDGFPSLLDATVTCSRHHDLLITTRERSGLDAAWFDWAYERPLNFASVFPTRLDCSRATLATGEVGYQPLLNVMRLVLDFACVSARHPARTTTRDSIDGRTLSWSMFDKVRLGANTDPLALIARPMAEQLAVLDDAARETGAAQTAARVLGAWASMADEQDASLRRSCAEAALSLLPDEVETQLRVGAARLADSDDEAGLELLEQAAINLQERELAAATDQVNFVLGELYADPGCPLAVGRAAAGVVLVGARVPKEQLPYFRDDILDEVDHGGTMVGLDQHKAIILETFRMLESLKGFRPAKGPNLRLVGQKKKGKAGKRSKEASGNSAAKVARAGKAVKTAAKTKKPAKKRAKKSAVVGRIVPQAAKGRKKAA